MTDWDEPDSVDTEWDEAVVVQPRVGNQAAEVDNEWHKTAWRVGVDFTPWVSPAKRETIWVGQS